MYLPVCGGFYWDLMFMGCAAMLCGVTGFVSGRLDRGPRVLSDMIVGWLIPWTVLCLWLLSSVGWNAQELVTRGQGLPELLVFSTWTLTAVVTGVIGTVVGLQWRRRRDWLRLATFCLLLLALSYFWSAMLDLTLVCR